MSRQQSPRLEETRVMDSIATCPGCTAQLAIPAAATANCRILCPECAAEFALGETIQLTLPKAMILPPNEVSPVVEKSPSLEATLPREVPEACAPLASWESRLKNAISADAEPQQATYETFEPTSDGAPSCDLTSHLKSTSVPDAAKNSEQPVLADLSAAYLTDSGITNSGITDSGNTDSGITESGNTESGITESGITESGNTESGPVEGVSPETVTAEFSQVDKVELPQRVVSQTSSQQPRRRWRRALGVVLGGPVVGTLLGFYGLLWIQGPQSDYLHLSRILPGAMLPATREAGRGEVETTEPKNSLLAALPKNDPLEASGTRYDTRVQPAAARQQVRLPGISAKKFGQLVADANAALPSFLQTGSAGEGSFQQKAQAYMVVCRLAEQFNFIDQLGLSPHVQQQIDQGKSLFQIVATDVVALEDLTYIASRWWEYEERSNQGIFFVGQISSIEPRGSRALCQLLLPDNSGREIPVLLDSSQFRRGEQIAVVGTVEGNPAQYGVDLPRIVMSHYSYALR